MVKNIVQGFGKLKKMFEKKWNGMELFEGFKKLKKMKNENGMKWEK